jgi:hypothetical protein
MPSIHHEHNKYLIDQFIKGNFVIHEIKTLKFEPPYKINVAKITNHPFPCSYIKKKKKKT